jgi:ribosome maturation factor RimP
MNERVEHSADETTRRVRTLVDEVVAGTDIFVVELEVRGSGGSRVVDIYVESDEDLSIEKLAEVNREVGFLLDVEDLIPGRYNLNVSSPGLDRPLRLPRQYRKNIGKPLRVHYNKPDGAGTTEIEGELVDVDDVAIEVKDGGDVRSIPLQDIVWAKIRLPW